MPSLNRVLSKLISLLLLISFLSGYSHPGFLAQKSGKRGHEGVANSGCGMEVCCCSGSARSTEADCAMTADIQGNTGSAVPTCFFSQQKCDPRAAGAIATFSYFLPLCSAPDFASWPFDKVNFPRESVSHPDYGVWNSVFHPPRV